MEDGKEKSVVIRSYSKVWKVESRIYAIQNIVLPFPINPKEILYFGVGALVVFVLGVILPPIRMLPAILRYGALPVLAVKFIGKKKLDGKNPLKYLGAMVRYFISARNYTERFRDVPVIKSQKIKIDWWCSSCV